MSKFVTYPAVTVLDNDHSLLVDDPNAGTNSITAENAGNTLLSKWAGFETFDEAVQNTIEHNQEFIDRDTAIREETAELKKKIVTTFPAKDASGAIATFESEFEDAPLKSCIVQVEPVQDLHGYDHPWPAGGGKNLFQTTAETTTVNGVTFTVNSDGSIKTTGTPTANISTFIFGKQTLPSGEYIANGFANGVNSGTRMIVFNENTGTVLAIIYKNNEATFTLTEESVVRVYPIILTESYESGWTFYPMIRKSTEADATFAPYSNECPITGWTGCEVQRTGVNVWDEEWEIGNFNFDTGLQTPSSSRLRSKNYIPCKGDTVYYGAFDGVYLSGSWYGVLFYGADKSYLGYKPPNKNNSFTTHSDAHYMKFVTSDAWYGVEYTGGISINYPSTDHDYHPYTGRTYPITFPTEAGTVYGGYVDVTGGELVVDRAIRTITAFAGTWGATSNGFAVFDTAPNGMRITGADVVSNMFTKSSNGYSTMPTWSFVGGNGIRSTITFVLGNGIASKAEADAFAASNPIQYTYLLVEPIHYPLTPTEIKTLLGQNNIWADTGGTAVEYLMSDVSWYVEKKLRAFQSILAGVEDSTSASKNYSANTYLIFNNDIYRVTKAITAGETIEEGVNVTKTTVAEQLMALAQA